MENPITVKMDDLGVPLFSETPILGFDIYRLVFWVKLEIERDPCMA